MSNLMKTLGGKINVEVTKEDLVAVQVSQLEEQLIATRIDLEEKIEDLSKKQEKLDKQINKACQDVAESDAERRLKGLLTAASELSGEKLAEKDTEVNVEQYLPASSAEYIAKDHHIQYRASVAFGKKSGKKSSEDMMYNIEATIKLPIPKDILDMIDQAKTMSDTNTEYSDNLYKVRRALQDMSRFERQAKANIAKKLIQATEDGKEMNLEELFNIKGFKDVKLIGQA
jgi:cell division septum initiation protein DivIVA